MTINNNVAGELEAHKAKMDGAQQMANGHLQTCIQNVQTQLEAFTVLENAGFVNRLISLSAGQAVNPADDPVFTISP
jgi:hypothetical protein